MPRTLHKLTAVRVAKETRKGRHSDGGGLYLDIGDGGRRRWIYRYRDRGTGRLRDMGLGSARTVSLAQARAKATENRILLQEGKDPIDAGRTSAPSIPTFGEMADQLIESMSGSWRNETHRAQWSMTLGNYAAPLRSKRV